MGLRRYHVSATSTQTEAIEWARAGAAPGSRVIAGKQLMGVGRLCHRWDSPSGGLYMSLVTSDPVVSPSLVPLAVGIGLQQLFTETYGATPKLRWPNDLMIPGAGGGARKLGGVLVDRVESGRAAPALVVGVGVNVNAASSAFDPALRPTLVGLAELTERPVDLRDLEEKVTDRVLASVSRLQLPDGPASIVEEVRRALYGVGRPALVDGDPVGTIRGVADDGALEVETDRHVSRIMAGSLTVEESA